MLTKNYLRPGPNEIEYFENDPLDAEFLEAFAKTSYRTTTWKRKLKVPAHHKDQYTLDWRGPLHLSASKTAMKTLLQRHIDEHSEWRVVAFYVLHDLTAKKCDDYWYEHVHFAPNIRFDAFRNVLLYELILQHELLIYSYDVDRYLTRVKYYAYGHFSEGNGIGVLYFNAGGYRIVDKVQWHVVEP